MNCRVGAGVVVGLGSLISNRQVSSSVPLNASLDQQNLVNDRDRQKLKKAHCIHE